jgi:hypothetical protein
MKHKRSLSIHERIERILGRKVVVVRVTEVAWRASVEAVPGVMIHGTGATRSDALRSLLEVV